MANRRESALWWACALAIVAAVAWAMSSWTRTGGDVGWLLLIAGVSTAVMLVVHEAGHAIAGVMARFSLREIVVAPIRAHRVGKGWHVSGSAGIRSWVLALPRDDRGIRVRSAAVIAGGPAADLLLAGVLFAASRVAPGAGHLAGAGAGLDSPAGRLHASALIVLGGALFNLIPFRRGTGAWLRDGVQLMRLAQGGAVMERDLALQLIQGANEALGRRPAEWDPEWIARALACRDGSASELTALIYAYVHAVDRGETEAADRHSRDLVQLVEASANPAWTVYYSFRAGFEARFRRNVEEARRWLEVAGPEVPRDTVREVEAEIALVEGRREDALTAIRACRDDLQRHMRERGRTGMLVQDEDALRRMETEAMSIGSRVSDPHWGTRTT